MLFGFRIELMLLVPFPVSLENPFGKWINVKLRVLAVKIEKRVFL